VIDGRAAAAVRRRLGDLRPRQRRRLGEALYQVRDELPTYRAHNEQAMAHAAIAFAKASFRRRMMACTSSIGPGATNMVTAAALAHVNRLPLLLLPGDVFANRAPDPVLQQVEDFRRRHGQRQRLLPAGVALLRPHHAARADHPGAARAMQVLTDPAECGPVTLALCQDVQAEAFDYPESFFEPRVWQPRRPPPTPANCARRPRLLKRRSGR
jgi:3D-(3,5/4)-trihydroxycyclohexane-1,2-dione acylhydrolase (decyclizing)